MQNTLEIALQLKLMSAAIVLFAKAPIAGNVKTRLQPPLTPSQAADLHFAFVLDFWERLCTISDVSLYLYGDQPWSQHDGPASQKNYGLQSGRNLGERMLHCFKEIQGRGYERVLIVGSDSPTLPISYLEEGLERLRHTDAVLGPSEDGGYYAVGCRHVRSRMFAGVHWSSACTRAETDRAFARAGLQSELLPSWYDVDTAKDLRRLATELSLPSAKPFLHIKAWLDRQYPYELRR